MLQGPDCLQNGAAAAGCTANGDAAAAGVSTATPSLRQVCLELRDKVEAFLAENVETKLLKGVQAQVKEAMGVIDEALEKYRCVLCLPLHPTQPGCHLGPNNHSTARNFN